VLRAGILQPCEDLQVLCDLPANLFLAAFIGSPVMDLYEANLVSRARKLHLGNQSVALQDEVRLEAPYLASCAGSTVIVGVRPEDLPAAAEGVSSQILEGTVDLVEALGSELLVHFGIDARRVHAEEARTAEEGEDMDSSVFSVVGESVARVEPRTPVRVGERARFAVQPARLHFFDASSGEAIR